MQSQTVEFGWTTVYCDSPTAVFIPLSPWMSAPDVQYLRCTFDFRALVGNIQVQAGYQTANNTRSPDTAVGFGDTVSSEGVEDPSEITDVGSTFKAKESFRFGFMCSNTSGSTLSVARVSGSLMKIFR